MRMVSKQLQEYFRCSSDIATFRSGRQIALNGDLRPFFEKLKTKELFRSDLGSLKAEGLDGVVEDTLPFDPDSLLNYLRHERYARKMEDQNVSWREIPWLRQAYYFFRSAVPSGVRRSLQRTYFRDWSSIPFPNWPVDFTADELARGLLGRSLESRQLSRTPFVWFWPDGYRSCAIMTHDVETDLGRDFCESLMEIDSAFGVPASFHIVPEERYEVSADWLASFRDQGFEIGLQGLNHDGLLFSSQTEFSNRCKKINAYAREYGAVGFRSPVLYRNPDWFKALEFSYDMSIPNVAHLEIQRGGCCTVMPYFIDRILELPVTTTQDYSLFHILRDYSADVWNQQIELIQRENGLISFLTHPDYLIDPRAQDTYKGLLERLGQLRDSGEVWTALPRDVNSWWRNRSQMQVVKGSSGWSIEGPGQERARLAYAILDEGRVRYQID